MLEEGGEGFESSPRLARPGLDCVQKLRAQKDEGYLLGWKLEEVLERLLCNVEKCMQHLGYLFFLFAQRPSTANICLAALPPGP